MKKVVIVGGGAAGMMAAIAAAENGHEVHLYEKNEKLGKKVFITGKGRCNVTNACDIEDLFQNTMSNSKFLYSAFYTLSNQAVMDFFEKAGCRLKIERGGRVFPVSDHSSDIIQALQKEMKRTGVSIHLETEVTKLLVLNNASEDENADKEQRVSGLVLKNGQKVRADRIIVATGGISYPLTGSTGDGLRMAEKTGHRMVECKPSLVPFEIKETFCKDLMGLALKNVEIVVKEKEIGKEIYQGFGEMLFTHFGVSGPLILSASSYYVSKLYQKEAELKIDLKPALSKEQLDRRLLRDFEENNKKQFKNALQGLLPVKLIPIVIDMSGINPEKRVCEISRVERTGLIEILKGFPLTITGTRGYEEAIITKGGVSVKDINPSTMESKKMKNLFFAGEVLDLDALTGGFNLQIAWSTGYLAGISV